MVQGHAVTLRTPNFPNITMNFGKMLCAGGSMKTIDILGDDPKILKLTFELDKGFVCGIGQFRASNSRRQLYHSHTS